MYLLSELVNMKVDLIKVRGHRDIGVDMHTNVRILRSDFPYTEKLVVVITMSNAAFNSPVLSRGLGIRTIDNARCHGFVT